MPKSRPHCRGRGARAGVACGGLGPCPRRCRGTGSGGRRRAIPRSAPRTPGGDQGRDGRGGGSLHAATAARCRTAHPPPPTRRSSRNCGPPAVVLGKAHTTEYAFFDPSPAATGTQTVASVNRPAAYCCARRWRRASASATTNSAPCTGRWRPHTAGCSSRWRTPTPCSGRPHRTPHRRGLAWTGDPRYIAPWIAFGGPGGDGERGSGRGPDCPSARRGRTRTSRASRGVLRQRWRSESLQAAL